MIRIAILLSLAACSKAEPTKQDPAPTPTDRGPNVAPPRQPEITVELSSVTLADDCVDGQSTKPIAPPTKKTASNDAPAASESVAASERVAPSGKIAAPGAGGMPSAGACADPKNCHGPSQPPCEQTSMQLSLRASEPTTMKIKKVELLDSTGKVVDTLTARAPSQWVTDKYVAWDEAIRPTQDLATSYKLSSPNWSKISNGRWNAHGMTFKLRVTVTVGTSDRTIEKQSITPAMLEPAVAT